MKRPEAFMEEDGLIDYDAYDEYLDRVQRRDRIVFAVAQPLLVVVGIFLGNLIADALGA